MAKPMPLTVYGPVTPLSPAVRVTGVLPLADVQILANGIGIGQAIASSPGELWVPLTSQPGVGQNISATQKTTDGTSDAAKQTVPVIDVPNPLPVPVIFSDLNTCMVDIWAGALVPGAKVLTNIGGVPFGSTVPSQPNSLLGINASQSIGAGAQAEVHQEATIAGVLRKSNTVKSLPIPAFTTPADLLPPPVLGPLVQCDTSRSFLQVTAGAALTIVNETQSESWINPNAAYTGYGAPPLIKGKAVAKQEMPRCHRDGQPATLPVAPATIPGAPTVTQDLCPQLMRLYVSGLEPGGILHVWRRVLHDPAGTSMSQAPVGDSGIAKTSQIVDLPPSLSLTDPAGTVVIALWQSRCAGEGPTTVVKVAAPGGPFGAPTIIEPLFDCGRYIPVKGAHPGSALQAIDVATGIAISDLYITPGPNFTLPLWFPLVGGQKVLVRQSGCNADGDSAVVRANPLPNPLPNPKIVEPIRPHAPLVKVTGIIPGARLHLLVNNKLRPGSVDCLATEGSIPVSGALLAENDQVFVIQTICDHSSNIEGHGVTVKKGNLKVSVAPSTVSRGSTASVTVTATDADTGVVVTAQVLLNGKAVGTTGVAFSYSPKAGDPNPSGIAREPIAYFDQSFSITLTDPTWTLFVAAGPVPVYLDAIKIDLTEISWLVTPDWNASLAKTLSVSPGGPSANSSINLPIPPGAVKTVTVMISGKASTQGGNWNGYTVEPQSFTIGIDTQKVAFHGPNEQISWLLLVKYIVDPATSEGVFNVVPTFVGIKDV